MKFYIRSSDSGDIRGPFTREEIKAQLPREIDRQPWMALADRDVRRENLPQSKGWVPLAALFPRIDTVPEANSHAPETKSRYESERFWVDLLSRCVILYTFGNALYQLYLANEIHSFAPVWSAIGTVIIGCLGALGVRYLIYMVADIADAQQERLEKARRNG
ncbi:MAG: hypothetical protein QM755_20090 [Luteolibacter sp.]